MQDISHSLSLSSMHADLFRRPSSIVVAKFFPHFFLSTILSLFFCCCDSHFFSSVHCCSSGFLCFEFNTLRAMFGCSVFSLSSHCLFRFMESTNIFFYHPIHARYIPRIYFHSSVLKSLCASCHIVQQHTKQTTTKQSCRQNMCACFFLSAPVFL